MAVRYEIAVGLNKGHKTAKVKNVKYTGDKKAKGLRASRMKNVSVYLWCVRYVCVNNNTRDMCARSCAHLHQ